MYAPKESLTSIPSILFAEEDYGNGYGNGGQAGWQSGGVRYGNGGGYSQPVQVSKPASLKTGSKLFVSNLHADVTSEDVEVNALPRTRTCVLK